MTTSACAAYLRQMVERAATGLVVGVVVLAMGCGGHHRALVDLTVRVPADPPPPPASWPRYPPYPASSCWTRPFPLGRPLRSAPSRPLPLHSVPVAPAEVVRRLLSGFGDRRYVHRVELGPPPRITLQHLHGYFAGARPPANALWAYVSAPTATQTLPTHPGPARVEAEMIAQWEAGLVVGALRDDFCAAGGSPLVGWTLGKGGIGLSDRSQALEQQFPNPPPERFRQRVALIGRRYGFRVQELRLLRPRQLAPLLLVHTDRGRKVFVHDVPAIMKLLDPTSSGAGPTAITFEGFFFEAADRHGPFVAVDNHYRGEVEGGEWSSNPCLYPYAHGGGPVNSPCP